MAQIVEGIDADPWKLTDYSILPGDSFVGTIGATWDSDWVRVRLQPGHCYDFTIKGAWNTTAYSHDGSLDFWNARGESWLEDVVVNYSTSLAVGFSMTLSALNTGANAIVIYASVDPDGAGVGSYTLSVADVTPPTGSVDDFAQFLIERHFGGPAYGPTKFDTSRSNELTVNLSGISPAGAELARLALASWASAADVVFRETTGSARIYFRETDGGAETTSTYSGGFKSTSTVWISTDKITDGTFSNSHLETFIHELGHVLGLGHAGHYDYVGLFPEDAAFANDSIQMSVMSYMRLAGLNANPLVDATFYSAFSPMMADIVAIQRIYGASQVTAGNSVYGAQSVRGGYVGDLFEFLASGAGGGFTEGLTLYDQGGYDVLDLSFYSGQQRVDLRPEHYSDILGLRGNLGLARGTVIESLIVGAGDDELLGNAVGNRMDGGDGRDRIDGLSGRDTLLGHGDADRLYGGAGGDRLSGGAGDDWLYGGAGGDAFLFAAGKGLEGVDRIKDFAIGEDVILLDARLFDGLARGPLAAGAFLAVAGGAAEGAEDRILYDTETGKLRFDADGTGAGQAIVFANLSAGLQMTQANFLIV